MSKRSGKSVPIPKPTWTIPADWLEIHPVENHVKLQADVNRLLVAESKLAKKINAEEDQNKAARIVRDHLAKARVLLVLLSPTITIFEAQRHPLVNGECYFFASHFYISMITVDLSASSNAIRRKARPRVRLLPWPVVSMGCSVKST